MIEISTSTAPTLGTYSNATLVQAQTTTVTPASAPVYHGTFTSITASASAGFLGTLAVNSGTGAVTITAARPAGTYTITVTATTTCATSQRTFTLTVTPLAAPTSVTAQATTTTIVGIQWAAVPGAAQYRVLQNANGAGYQLLATTANTNVTSSGLTANTAYLYHVQAVDAVGGFGPLSAQELATTVMTTQVTPGMTIAQQHVLQLREAVNAVRRATGNANFAFTDATLTAQRIKAIHAQELRTVLNAARTALGLPAIAGAAPVAGNVVSASDFVSIRDGVR